MDRRVQIPVNVKSKPGRPPVDDPDGPTVSEARPPVSGRDGAPDPAAPAGDGGARAEARVAGAQPPAAPAPAQQFARGEQDDWRDRALRLQAEMENFRKRQQRVAQDQIQAERERLLRSFLPVVDDLERALAAQSPDGQGLREGVQLTLRAALQLLQREGVERIEDKGRPFDPNWHEAVTTVDHKQAAVEPNTIVGVLEPGYRYRDQLLRPARVVVAV